MSASRPDPSEVEPGRVLFADTLEQRLLVGVAVGPGEEVLELASGLGAMCVRLAELVRPGGRTICSDIRPDRVAATRRRVDEAGAHDVDVRLLDMARLDLPDASVDGVLCRWGFMFPLPPEDAFAEALRVLRPGRCLALAVWADPRRNPWITRVDDALVATGHEVPADRAAPGRMFSLADPQRLGALLASAGFDAIAIEEVPLAWGYDDFDAYWEEEAAVAGPFEDFLRGLPAADLVAIRDRLRASIEPFRLPDGDYRMPGLTLVATCRRPAGRPTLQIGRRHRMTIDSARSGPERMHAGTGGGGPWAAKSAGRSPSSNGVVEPIILRMACSHRPRSGSPGSECYPEVPR